MVAPDPRLSPLHRSHQPMRFAAVDSVWTTATGRARHRGAQWKRLAVALLPDKNKQWLDVGLRAGRLEARQRSLVVDQ